MEKSPQKTSSRLDIVVAFLIATASLTFAFAAWRISMVSSSAGDASRLGILDAIKKQTATNENWRLTYQEANSSENYAVFLAELEALEASRDPVAVSQAASMRQYLLPSLQLLASPMATNPTYQNQDGTYDLQKRFEDIEAENPDLRDLDPQESFLLADRYYSEQRWLTVATVLMAISLFWLALAEVSRKQWRTLVLIIGTIVYGVGLSALVMIEVLFFILRGGVL